MTLRFSLLRSSCLAAQDQRNYSIFYLLKISVQSLPIGSGSPRENSWEQRVLTVTMITDTFENGIFLVRFTFPPKGISEPVNPFGTTMNTIL